MAASHLKQRLKAVIDETFKGILALAGSLTTCSFLGCDSFLWSSLFGLRLNQNGWGCLLLVRLSC